MNTGPASAVLPPGTYFTAIAHYPDGSDILSSYGLHVTKGAAEAYAKRLREAGIHVDETWTVTPLRIIELGPQP